MSMENEEVCNKSIKLNAVLNIFRQCCHIVFPLITYPYISRILGSSNLGRYSFADSIVQYFLILASLGIPTYAIREGARLRSEKGRLEQLSAQLFTLSLLSLTISILLLSGITWCVPRIRREGMLIFILAFNIVFNIIGRDWVNTIYEDFLYISIRFITFQFFALVCTLLFVKCTDDYLKYAIICMMANSGGYLVNLFYSKKYLPIRLTKNIGMQKHLKPVLYLFCITVTISIYVKSDITVLGFLSTDSEVGIYTLASKIYTIIKSVLNAVITVTLPRISYYLGDMQFDNYNKLIRKIRQVLYTVVFPTIIGVFCLSSDIMLLLGGKEYQSGYKALAILCLALFFSVFGGFYSQAILIPNREEKYFFKITLISAIMNVLLNIVIIPFTGLEGAAFTTVIAEIFVLFACRKKAKNYVDMVGSKGSIEIGFGCIAIAFICFTCRMLITQLLFRVIVCILASVIIYGLILLIGGNPIAIICIRKIKKLLTN